MGPCAPFDQGEKPMFYALIKHWVFDQSEQAQGPIFIVLLKTVSLDNAIREFSLA